MPFKRISLPLVLMLVFLFTLVSGVFAIEIPPVGNPTYIQTNGPFGPNLTRGDWYTNDNNGIAAGSHYFAINVPPGWPGDDIVIDLFSAEMNDNNPAQDEDDDGTPNNTSFEMYPPGTTVGPNPNVPAAGTGIAGSLTNYAPSAAAEDWVRFFVITSPVAGSTYILRASSLVDDQNGWRMRVGADNDNDPSNGLDPVNPDNRDGVPGTNDELSIGVYQTAYQQSSGGEACLTLYEFVGFGQATAVFHNFDIDGGSNRIRYYAPSDVYDPTGTLPATAPNGTLSSDSQWNGGTTPPPVRGGDTVSNPEPGWWRVVTCINSGNQYIQEAQSGIQAFYEQPPTPQMTIVKDDGLTTVTAGQQITYTLTFTNTSSGATAGAANNVVITDPTPAGTTFVSAAFGPGFTGTITSPPVGGTGTVTFAVSGAVNAGATGTATITVQVDAGATGQVINTAQLDYQDGLGNQFAPVSDDDIDDIPQGQPGSVSGTVFNDTNGNGVQDPGEPGIPNITVTVTGPSGTFNLTTDGSGNYSQAQLTLGSYSIDVDTADPDLPAGASLTTGNDPANVTVPAGGNAVANFGFVAVVPGSISGTVFNDTNGNGVQDPGETGIPNITVTINGPSGTFTVTTDANGFYIQTGLNPGSYTVDVDAADPDMPPSVNLTTGNDPATVIVPQGGGGVANFGYAPSSVAIQPTLSLTDPFITKSVNPPFALPGEQVTWTITVTNPGTVPATNVNVSDTLPGEVAIQSVTASSGTVSFSGQIVNFTLPSLGAGQTVVITVVTRVRDDAALPFTITNLASLTNAENPTPRTAQATVVSAGQLPETGEAAGGNWRLALVGFASAVAVYVSFRLFRSH